MPFKFNPISGVLDYYASAPTDYVTVSPATQARNTVQPTANATGLTLKKYYSPPATLDPSALSTGTLIGWWIGDDYISGPTWADHGPNGYDLTGYANGSSTLNGHKTLTFNGAGGYFINESDFTVAQPFVVFAVIKANYAGSDNAGSTFVDSGSTPVSGRIAQYYESANRSPGWAMYAGTGWDPIDVYGTVGLACVVVAKYNGSSSYIRSGGNTDTTGNPGTNSMTGINIGNAYNYLANANGAIAEVVLVSAPSDAEIDGIEAYLADKYALSLESASQTEDMLSLQTGVGDEFFRVDSNGTIIPKLLSSASSALDVGVFSNSYPNFRITPSRIELGDGTYDVEGQSGSYQKGWEFNAPTQANGNFGFMAKSNYVEQQFQVRPPGNGLFAVDPGLMKVSIDTYAGGHIGPLAANRVALQIQGFASQTANLQNWATSAGTVLASVNKDGWLAIGSQSPTAYLHLKAGTATANTAPLKLTSGTLNTTAEAGAVEFTTDDFFATITTGAARKAFVLDDGTRLTSGRIPFATTNGRLTDDADLTFATDTLTATKVVGSTSVSSPLVESTGVVRLKGYTVGTLPVGTQGDTAFVTDSLAPTFLTAVVGGGAIVTPVFYDGTNWVSY